MHLNSWSGYHNSPRTCKDNIMTNMFLLFHVMRHARDGRIITHATLTAPLAPPPTHTQPRHKL
jgi:hypothetical protein